MTKFTLLVLVALATLGLAVAQGPTAFKDRRDIELIEGLWEDIELNHCSTFAAVDKETLSFHYFPSGGDCTVTVTADANSTISCSNLDTRPATVSLTSQGSLEISIPDPEDPENPEKVKTWLFKQCSFDEAAMLGDMYLYRGSGVEPKHVTRSFEPKVVDTKQNLTKYHYTWINEQGLTINEYFYYDNDSPLNGGVRVIKNVEYPFIYWTNPDGSYMIAIVNDPSQPTEPSFDPKEPNVAIEHYGRKPGEPTEGRYTYSVNFAAISQGQDFSCHERKATHQTQTGNSFEYSWAEQVCTETFEKYTNRGKMQCITPGEAPVTTLYPFVYNLEQDGSITYVVSVREFKDEAEFVYPNLFAIRSNQNVRYTLYPCTAGYALRGSWSRNDLPAEACAHMIPFKQNAVSVVEQDITLVFSGDNAGSFVDGLCQNGCPFTSAINDVRTFTVRVSADATAPPPISEPKRDTDRELIYTRCQFSVYDGLYGTFLDENSRRVQMLPTTDVNVRSFTDSDGFSYTENLSSVFSGVSVRQRVDGEQQEVFLATTFGADGTYFGLETTDRATAEQLASGLIDTRAQAELGRTIHTYVPYFDSAALFRGDFYHNTYDVCVSHTPTKNDRQASWIEPSTTGNGRCTVDLASNFNGGRIKCDTKVNQFLIFSRDLYTGAFYIARGDSLAKISLTASDSLQLWKPCPVATSSAFKGALRAPVVFDPSVVINFNKFDSQWGSFLSPKLPDSNFAPCYTWSDKPNVGEVSESADSFTITGVDAAGNPCDYTFGMQDGVGRTTCRFTGLPDKDSVFYYQVSGLGIIYGTIYAKDNTVKPPFRHQSDKTLTFVISRCMPPTAPNTPSALTSQTGADVPFEAASIARFVGSHLVVRYDTLAQGPSVFDAIGYEGGTASSQNRLVVRKVADGSVVMDVSLLNNGQVIDNTNDAEDPVANGLWSIDHTDTLSISLGTVNPVTSSLSTLGESYTIRRGVQTSFPLSKRSKWAPADSTDPNACVAFSEIKANVFGGDNSDIRYQTFKGDLPGFGIQSSQSDDSITKKYAITYYYDNSGAFVVRRNGNSLDDDNGFPAPIFDPAAIPESLKSTFTRYVPCAPVVHMSYFVTQNTDFPIARPINQRRLLSQLRSAAEKATTPAYPVPDLSAFGNFKAEVVPEDQNKFNVSFVIAAVKTGAVSTTAQDIVNMFKNIKPANVADFTVDVGSAAYYVDDTLQPSPAPAPPSGGGDGVTLTTTVIVTIVVAFASMAIAFIGIKLYYRNSGGPYAGIGGGLAGQSSNTVNYDTV